MYVKIVDGHIAGLFDGAKPADDEDYRDVPDSYAGVDGMLLDEFNEDWSVRSLQERLDAGLLENGQYYKVERDELVFKDLPERVRDGIDAAPAGFKLVMGADGTTPLLERMTTVERLAAGQITQATADLLQTSAMRYERNDRFLVVDNIRLGIKRAIRRAEAAGEDLTALEVELEKWETYGDLLADVPQQGGFPWAIEWPPRPDGVAI